MNIMVTLIKINKTNEYIEANYIPEHEPEEGYIKMRLSDHEIVERKLTPSDGKVTHPYFVHARNGLVQVLKEDTIPAKWVVMWY